MVMKMQHPTDRTEEARVEENLRLLAGKEHYYCSLQREDFFGSSRERTERENEQTREIRGGTEPSVVLLANEQDVGYIVGLAREIDDIPPEQEGRVEHVLQFPLYLYYDEEQFIRLVREQDLRPLCQMYRAVILVGGEALEDFFCRMDAVFPDAAIGDEGGWISAKLEEIKAERIKLLNELWMEVFLYYRQNGEAIKKRVLEGRAKICVLKYYYESARSRNYYLQFKKALEKLGYAVELCGEEGPIFIKDEIMFLYEHRPDIVFQINKHKDGFTYSGPPMYLDARLDNLIYINWSHDNYPQTLNAQYARSLGKRDYVFSFYDAWVMRQYGFPDAKVIYGGTPPADDDSFRIWNLSEEEHRRFDCDIAYAVGHLRPEIWGVQLDNLLGRWNDFEPAQIDRISVELLPFVEGMYDPVTGKYITDQSLVRQYAAQVAEKLQCSGEQGRLIEHVLHMLQYYMLRRLVVEDLAAQKKYRIVFYGSSDPEIDGVEYGGCLHDRAELSKALSCAKLTLQITANSSINQCVAEGLLSHTPLLVYRMKQEDTWHSIESYLAEGEGFLYFDGTRELVEQCDRLLNDEALREEIAERGYRKARRLLTTDAVYGHLMEELQAKLRAGGE